MGQLLTYGFSSFAVLICRFFQAVLLKREPGISTTQHCPICS